jgi:hypothetical protein
MTGVFGRLLQQAGDRIRRAPRTLRVQLGVDLGTHSTKVMYRMEGRSTQPSKLVLFGRPSSERDAWPRYLQPSTVGVAANGHLVYGHAAVAGTPAYSPLPYFRQFKLLFADEKAAGKYAFADSWKGWETYRETAKLNGAICRPSVVTAAFLASVVREAKKFIAQEEGLTSLDAQVRVCLPFDQAEERSVASEFERILAAAEELERWLENPGDSGARSILTKSRELLDSARWSREDSKYQWVPEARAAFGAFASQRGREDGVYALYDIGEGTTDVCIMEYAGGGAGRPLETFSGALSVPKAVAWIEEQVARDLKSRGDPSFRQAARAIIASASVAAQVRDVYERALDEWKIATNEAWRQAYRTYRKQHNFDRNRVRLFVAGGGARLPRVDVVLTRAWAREFGPFPVAPLPSPEEYQFESKAPFARMCIAYGLSLPLDEISDFKPPSLVADRTPPTLRRLPSDEDDDGDQLDPYAK